MKTRRLGKSTSKSYQGSVNFGLVSIMCALLPLFLATIMLQVNRC